jgi:hypothetical protein
VLVIIQRWLNRVDLSVLRSTSNGRGEQVVTVACGICMVSVHLGNHRQCRWSHTPDLARLIENEDSLPVSQQVPLCNGGVS